MRSQVVPLASESDNSVLKFSSSSLRSGHVLASDLAGRRLQRVRARDALVLSDGLFLLGVVLLVEVVDGVARLGDRIFLLLRGLLFPLGNVGLLLLAPVPVGIRLWSD